MPGIWVGAAPPPPTPPSSPPFQTASSSLNSLDLGKKRQTIPIAKSMDVTAKSAHFFQNFGKIPQQSSMPLSAFSAICMSALMESIPDSIFSSCSVGQRDVFGKRQQCHPCEMYIECCCSPEQNKVVRAGKCNENKGAQVGLISQRSYYSTKYTEQHAAGTDRVRNEGKGEGGWMELGLQMIHDGTNLRSYDVRYSKCRYNKSLK